MSARSITLAADGNPRQEETTMTVPARVSVFTTRNTRSPWGLTLNVVIAMRFSDQLLNSLRLPYNLAQLVNYVPKHFPQQRVVFLYETGPTGYGLYD
jgi:hypothetical protein